VLLLSVSFNNMVFQASRVAVIGAGVSGLTAAKHLKSTGAQVVLYERTGNVGGNWSVNYWPAIC
jgi:cation diffusion facilitator CzcD-associated flavoprotein CzcO